MKFMPTIESNQAKVRSLIAKRGAVIKGSLLGLGLLALSIMVSNWFGHFAPAAQAQALAENAKAPQAKPKVCTANLLKGDYGFSMSGNIASLGTINAVGSETCDGKGGCTGRATLNLNGTTYTDTFTSVETTNADCTGTATVTYGSGLVAHSATVLVNDGDEVHFISTDPGAALIGVSKRR